MGENVRDGVAAILTLALRTAIMLGAILALRRSRIFCGHDQIGPLELERPFATCQ